MLALRVSEPPPAKCKLANSKPDAPTTPLMVVAGPDATVLLIVKFVRLLDKEFRVDETMTRLPVNTVLAAPNDTGLL